MTQTFAVASISAHRLVVQPSKDDLGFVKIEGIDSQGQYKVWARNLSHQAWQQVGAFKRYDLAELMCKQMREDDRERRCCVREGKAMRWWK